MKVEQFDDYDADLNLQLKNWSAECQPRAGIRKRLLKIASATSREPNHAIDLPWLKPLSVQVSRSFSSERDSYHQVQAANWYFQLTSPRLVY